MKGLLKSFHFNGHTVGFHAQTSTSLVYMTAIKLRFLRSVPHISQLIHFRRKKKCVRFLAGGAGSQDLSPSGNTANAESENIDANIESNTAMIVSTNSTTPTS